MKKALKKLDRLTIFDHHISYSIVLTSTITEYENRMLDIAIEHAVKKTLIEINKNALLTDNAH